MHELPITEEILKIVLRHARSNGVAKVLSITLQIGKLSDLEDEWLQRYFDYLSKGTAAEGARLKIERMPLKFHCNACGHSYETQTADLGNLICPNCGEADNAALVSGREYFIKEMEAQ
ncbi:MAG TPA: hydrogenase maturation nickel metallochaperone HypA [Smithella sp.]|nr:hydrogenase maturation nickel metallochaperone HypA [Smithella sp.]HRS96930.1 hydrogenase maturation nickel metallochaperone HypA [Smithella sp.]